MTLFETTFHHLKVMKYEVKYNVKYGKIQCKIVILTGQIFTFQRNARLVEASQRPPVFDAATSGNTSLATRQRCLAGLAAHFSWLCNSELGKGNTYRKQNKILITYFLDVVSLDVGILHDFTKKYVYAPVLPLSNSTKHGRVDELSNAVQPKQSCFGYGLYSAQMLFGWLKVGLSGIVFIDVYCSVLHINLT